MLVPEFAARYGVVEEVARRWLRRGLVPGARKVSTVWEIDAAQLDGWRQPSSGRPRSAAPSYQALAQRKSRARKSSTKLLIDKSVA